MARICLITTGQPTTNPRLVKEADALVEAGHNVHVIASFWTGWAEGFDRELVKTRKWTCSQVGGSPNSRRALYLMTRGRHGFSHRLEKFWPQLAPLDWAICRVTPELKEAAQRWPADLYIAHNLGALPAAVVASRKHNARCGFDIEDFHSDQRAATNGSNGAVEKLERQNLCFCDYTTAATPGIAQIYKEKYGLAPTSILNVFPLKDRPASFRTTNSYSPLTLYWFSQTIGPNRGLEDVVKAMGTLSNLNVHLHLRGAWQPGYRANLFQLAAAVGVSEKQIHSYDPAPAQEMVRLSSKYDIGLSIELPITTNRNLCMGNKIFTYFLAGNAIIATNTEGHREILAQSGSAGVAYDAGDVKALSDHLRHWCTNKQSLDRARRDAWLHGEQTFNWDVEKVKFLDVVERTLSGTTREAKAAVS